MNVFRQSFGSSICLRRFDQVRRVQKTTADDRIRFQDGRRFFKFVDVLTEPFVPAFEFGETLSETFEGLVGVGVDYTDHPVQVRLQEPPDGTPVRRTTRSIRDSGVWSQDTYLVS